MPKDRQQHSPKYISVPVRKRAGCCEIDLPKQPLKGANQRLSKQDPKGGYDFVGIAG